MEDKEFLEINDGMDCVNKLMHASKVVGFLQEQNQRLNSKLLKEKQKKHLARQEASKLRKDIQSCVDCMHFRPSITSNECLSCRYAYLSNFKQKKIKQ